MTACAPGRSGPDRTAQPAPPVPALRAAEHWS